MINLVGKLKQYGIRAAAYKRPPAGKEVFALTILPRHKEGVVTVNQGQAKIEVHGSKKHRQAAVTVREYGRRVTRTVKWVRFDRRPLEEDIRASLKARFPLTMPSRTTWAIKNITCEAEEAKGPFNTKWNCSGVVTATVKDKTVNHFLMGMDESHNFIAALPAKANSVRKAHQLLRPNRVKPKAIRQGEWFFVPCGKRTTRWLNTMAIRKSGSIRSYKLGHTTHVARSAIYDKDTYYVRGYITDNRTGHHRSLFLPTWHEAVKNKETEIVISKSQREGRRLRTWD